MAEKFEPLKGKIYYLDTRYPMSIDKVPKFVRTEVEIFFSDDLKSAVQGLLQEIEKRREELLQNLRDEKEALVKAEDEMEEDVATTCIACIEARLSELRETEKLIKKWLSDAVSEDES